MSFNKCMFIGNLGRDADLRYTQGGQPVSTLNLAVNETWNDKAGQKQERVEWVRVVLWGKPAESLDAYLKKGKQILVEGSMQTCKWTDKDGIERYTTEIRAQRVVLLGGGGSGSRVRHPAEAAEAEPNQQAEPEPEPAVQLTDDDIPFAWLFPLLAPLAACSMIGSMLA